MNFRYNYDEVLARVNELNITYEEVQARIAEIQEELDFLYNNSGDFNVSELLGYTRILRAELNELQENASVMRLEAGFSQIAQNFCDSLSQAAEEAQAISDEEELVLEPTTVEVDSVEADEDDWLMEEWDNICNDPRGTRFQRPRPVFVSYIQYLLFVTGQLVNGVYYMEPQVQ